MSVIAEVETGALAGQAETAGRSRRRVHAFHGVPYAAPPTGELRFRAPQPAQPWPGVFQATEAGPVPMQALAGPFTGLIPGSSASAASEDCLTLEIWAPAEASNLPVMLWVPGGAFLTGGASLPTYDGSALAADHDVVVVGVNYRLGAFGFAWLEPLGGTGHDANCGLRDLLAALDWVVRNIGAFGGDPNNVTAFGESAGAGSLLHLLASTAELPLRRCVLQSPGVDHTLRADQGELVTEVLVRHLGEDRPDLARLQAVPAEAILGAQEKTVAELMSVVSAMPFHPVVDGDLLLTTPSVAFADGAAAGVDLIVSWTADEMRLFPNPAADAGGIEAITDWTRALLTRRLGDKPDDARVHQLVAFYQDRSAASGVSRLAELWSAILTDGVMRLPCRRIADSHSSSGGITYATEFSWHGSSRRRRMGSSRLSRHRSPVYLRHPGRLRLAGVPPGWSRRRSAVHRPHGCLEQLRQGRAARIPRTTGMVTVYHRDTPDHDSRRSAQNAKRSTRPYRGSVEWTVDLRRPGANPLVRSHRITLLRRYGPTTRIGRPEMNASMSSTTSR